MITSYMIRTIGRRIIEPARDLRYILRRKEIVDLKKYYFIQLKAAITDCQANIY